MFIVTLVRVVIWLTFFLLVVEAIIAIFWVRWFSNMYTRKHREVEVRLDALEERQKRHE
jgi:hypothetical protein